ncbi:hypothetical protein KAR91_66980 [Candidatus Pacearchaeota archaeon]|nr:hypothetical protein [Candidatus Pacearchaeota archaeon]
MVDYADLNPAGATRTTKTGRIRLVPQTLNYFNQKWFKDFMSDFQWKNSMENNGVISGCVISQDGTNNAINCTAGSVYINGITVTVAAPATFPTTGDGWYVAYATDAGSVIYGKMISEDVQGALTPDDAVLLGFVVQGQSTFFVKNYFNDVSDITSVLENHKLGTEAQVTSGDATIWYNDTAGVFKDADDATVTLVDYDRVAMIVDTADQDIDFPAGKEIVFVPYDAVDLDSNTLNLDGTYSGELRVDNGTVVITGLCHGLRINGTATVNTTSMTGTVIVNGVLIGNLIGDVTGDVTGDVAGNVTVGAGKTLDVSNGTLTLADDQVSGDKVHGGTIGGSPTIVTPTIADASAVSEVNSVKDQDGGATSGLKCRIIEIGDWDMDTVSQVVITPTLDISTIRSISGVVRTDSDAATPEIRPFGGGALTNQVVVSFARANAINLQCSTASFTADWNSTSYNRGWLMIWYEA